MFSLLSNIPHVQICEFEGDMMKPQRDPVRLKSITLRNIACFEDITIPFNDKIAVLLGQNGTGKTTILISLMVSISIVAGRETPLTYHPLTKKLNKDSELVLHIGNKKDDKKIYVRYEKRNLLKDAVIKEMNVGKSDIGLQGPIIFMPAFRVIKDKQIPGPVKEKSHDEKWKNIRRTMLKNVGAYHQEEVKQWIVNRDYLGLKKGGKQYKDQLNHFIKAFNELLPDDATISFVEVNEDIEPLFNTQTGLVPFGAFPSGFQSILAILWEITDQYQTYYEKSRNIFKESGTVIIDELDSHLHPEWQQVILNGLREMFPNTVSTHSPLIASGCKPGEAIFLKFDSEKKAVVIDKNAPSNPQGWMAERLLTRAFGLSSTRDKKWEEEIRKLKDIIADRYVEKISEEDKRFIKRIAKELELPSTDPVYRLIEKETLEEILEEK